MRARIYYLFDQLRGDKVFSKIDLRPKYYKVKMKKEYISNTTFKTRYRHYEYEVVPFGLSDVLFFQH